MTLPNYAIPTLLILLIAANIGLIAALKPFVTRLKDSGDKCSMVHFELAAGSARNAERIMAIWRDAKLEQDARISLWLDFAFLLAYPLGLALACWTLANGGSGWVAQAGICTGFLVLLCTPLDAAENIALLRMVDKGADGAIVRVAAVCAVIKFLLAGLAMLYLLIALPFLFLT